MGFFYQARAAQVSPEVRSLRLDAAGLDELRPFLLILVDEAGIIFRRARRDLGAIKPELLLHFTGGECRLQLLVELVDDGARRPGRRNQAVIERGVEARQP